MPLFVLLLALWVFPAAAETPSAETTPPPAVKGTGLPIPRFVTLRSGEVNIRTGPGARYPIDWVFTREGLPVEITAEFDTWRRIRAEDGTEGWVHQSLLTGKRALLVKGTSLQPIRHEANAAAKIVAQVEPGAQGELRMCVRDWCEVRFGDYSGYMQKTQFWGAYPAEAFD